MVGTIPTPMQLLAEYEPTSDERMQLEELKLDILKQVNVRLFDREPIYPLDHGSPLLPMGISSSRPWSTWVQFSITAELKLRGWEVRVQGPFLSEGIELPHRDQHWITLRPIFPEGTPS